MQLPLFESESKSKLPDFLRLLKSLGTGQATSNFSFYPQFQSKDWLNNSDCKANSLLSDLLGKCNQNLDLNPANDDQDFSEKFKNSELFLIKCKTLGFSSEEASNLLALLKVFNLAPPASFSHKEMTELMLKLKHHSMKYKEDYLQYLRGEVKERESYLAPLREEMNEAKTAAHLFANKLATTAITAIVANSAVFGYLALNGAAYVAAVGGIAGMGLRFSAKLENFKRSAYEYKFSRIIAKRQIKVELILQLQKELDEIRQKIIELNY